MAITLIRKKDSKGDYQNLMMSTEFIEGEDGVEVLINRVSMVDDELKELTPATLYSMELSEEEFHRSIRKEAAKKEQLITSHCTDPEWNPEGYSKNLEDE